MSAVYIISVAAELAGVLRILALQDQVDALEAEFARARGEVDRVRTDARAALADALRRAVPAPTWSCTAPPRSNPTPPAVAGSGAAGPSASRLAIHRPGGEERRAG
ncbi:MAG: hypothetical protein ACRDZ4_01455 [Egibacteraceae bacterium]